MNTFETMEPRERRGIGPPISALTLTIAAHPDVGRVGARVVLQRGQTTELGRTAPTFAGVGTAISAALGDPYVSRRPVLFRVAAAVTIDGRDSSTRLCVNGIEATDVVRLNSDDIAAGVSIRLGDRVVLWLSETSVVAESNGGSLGILGDSDGVRALREAVLQVADLDIAVLVRGPTGAGKELVAQAIRALSRRRSAAFIAVNIAAVAPTLASSELFGHVRGAFTGAVRDRRGAFERADGGTLFLDEVGDAPPDVQTMLLRVLDTGEFSRVGEGRVRKVDVRVISATDADLESMCASGAFRAQLLHRLAGVRIGVPSLAERRTDLGTLFVHFLGDEMDQLGERHKLHSSDPRHAPWLPPELVERLLRHSWPGNVRELRNVARQVAVAGRHKSELTLGPWFDALFLGGGDATTDAPVSGGTPRPRKLYRDPAEVSDEALIEALEGHDFKATQAAAALGISRTSIYALMERSPNVRRGPDFTRDELRQAAVEWGQDLDAMARHLRLSRHAMLARMTALGLSSATQ